MIVVDSSALVAIAFNEPDRAIFETAPLDQQPCVMSAVNVHETATVIRARLGRDLVRDFWSFLIHLGIEVVPFDEDQAHAAQSVFDRYGKGIHPRARLNICDCAAYALAETKAVPLLFKGDDFAHTDIIPAV